MKTVLIILALCLLYSCRQKGAQADWPVYGGNLAGNRYSTQTQINKINVNDLQVAWIYERWKQLDEWIEDQGTEL